jgi:hypothetical protein
MEVDYMYFYRIHAVLKNFDKLVPDEHDIKCCRAFENVISEASEELFKLKEESYVFLSRITYGEVAHLGVITVKPGMNIGNLIGKYAGMTRLELGKTEIEEASFHNIFSYLSQADNNGYIDDCDAVLEHFEIECLGRCCHMAYDEVMADEVSEKEALIEGAKNDLVGDTLIPEIERIYKGKAKSRADGHPVHYMVNVRDDDDDKKKQIYSRLISALYQNKRVKSRRYVLIDWGDSSPLPSIGWEALYKSCAGGTIVIDWHGGTGRVGMFAESSGIENISAICRMALEHRNDVLTVILLNADNSEAKNAFIDEFASRGSISMVELKEDIVFADSARDYLKKLASEKKIRPDKKLTGMVSDEGKGYTAANLNKIFDAWYGEKLKTNIYPQYKDTAAVADQVRKEEPKGRAIDKLNSLIGLAEAKQTIEKALNYYKMQKLYKDRGMTSKRPAMHMVFTGNPGTAKTTVARLFAQIMKDNGLLSKGDLYEVGRADLVGQYVGHTAPLVKKRFKEAEGSVLFIDEAYSLVDDRDGMYGDEAISTIVQEMENNRDNMVVIFAGYPDKMEKFMQKNPGLRSRIAFHVNFPDYATDDLCRIAELIAKDDGLYLAPEARAKLTGIFDSARKNDDFGNGRYVRNLIENAHMEQCNRLANMNVCDVTDDDIRMLAPEDIVAPNISPYDGNAHRFGFAV